MTKKTISAYHLSLGCVIDSHVHLYLTSYSRRYVGLKYQLKAIHLQNNLNTWFKVYIYDLLCIHPQPTSLSIPLGKKKSQYLHLLSV